MIYSNTDLKDNDFGTTATAVAKLTTSSKPDEDKIDYEKEVKSKMVNKVIDEENS